MIAPKTAMTNITDIPEVNEELNLAPCSMSGNPSQLSITFDSSSEQTSSTLAAGIQALTCVSPLPARNN